MTRKNYTGLECLCASIREDISFCLQQFYNDSMTWDECLEKADFLQSLLKLHKDTGKIKKETQEQIAGFKAFIAGHKKACGKAGPQTEPKP